MAQDLFEEFAENLESFTMKPGRKGSFEVMVNGATLFSKLQEHRFPKSKELIKAIHSQVLSQT